MEQILEILLKNNIFPQSTLFVGRKCWDIEKKVFFVIKYLFCNQMEKPCGYCISCRKVEKLVHPDLKVIELENNSKNIKINQIRDVQNFCQMTSFGNRKVILIKDAHLMSIEASNSLLKILEEPGENNYFILTTDNKYKLLPTILSRCVHFHLKPVTKDFIAQNIDDINLDKKTLEEFNLKNIQKLNFFEICEKLEFYLKELNDVSTILKLFIVINSLNTEKNINFLDALLNIYDDLKINFNKESVIGKLAFLIYSLKFKKGV